MAIVEARFFARPVEAVARALVGAHLRHGPVELRIVETEAYLGPHDTACHTARGRTERNAAMWGPLGRAYVYRCYGLHWMLNVVCGVEGGGSAVLIRAAEPLAGAEVWLPRRGGRADLAGPGKVAAALGLDRSFDGHDLAAEGGLELHAGTPPARLLAGPRVGIDYAAPADRDARLRFADADARVSARRTLAPLDGTDPG